MRILLIDDELSICKAIQFALEQEGYSVDVCHDGAEGLLWMQENCHDIVLLDRMLPHTDGISILKKARSIGINSAVIFVTALGDRREIIDGLDSGADDYLIKPIDIGEKLARIRACARRPQKWFPDAIIEYEGLRLNTSTRTLEWLGLSCELTKREAQLFEILIKNGGSVVERKTLFSYVWGIDANVDNGNLDSYIRYARSHLKELKSHIQIHTKRFTGCYLRALES